MCTCFGVWTDFVILDYVILIDNKVDSNNIKSLKKRLNRTSRKNFVPRFQRLEEKEVSAREWYEIDVFFESVNQNLESIIRISVRYEPITNELHGTHVFVYVYNSSS